MKHVIQKAFTKNTKTNKPVKLWSELKEKLTRFELQLQHCQTAMAFAFVEGSLIKAVKKGDAIYIYLNVLERSIFFYISRILGFIG